MNLWGGGLVYAVLSLDHFNVGPFLLSRPLVVGPLLGGLWGFPREGLWLGLLGEAVWSAVPPAGPLQWDVGLMTALSLHWATLPAVLSPDGRAPVWALAGATLVALPAGLVGRRIDLWARRWNGGFADAALAGLRQGDDGPARRGLWTTSFFWVVKSVLVFVVAGAVGAFLCGAVFPRVPGPAQVGLSRAWTLWAALGAAVVLRQFLARFFRAELPTEAAR